HAQNRPRRVEPRRLKELRVGRWGSRPPDHDDSAEPPNHVGLMPRPEQASGVPPEDQEEIVVRVQPFQLPNRVRGVGLPAAPDLDVRYLESWLALCREAAHLQAPLAAGDGRSAVRWQGAGDEQDSVEVRAFHRDARGRQVSLVDGVEGTAEDARSHGWYSNSTSAMRTVSPGATPADSSAELTPRRSSSL